MRGILNMRIRSFAFAFVAMVTCVLPPIVNSNNIDREQQIILIVNGQYYGIVNDFGKKYYWLFTAYY